MGIDVNDFGTGEFTQPRDMKVRKDSEVITQSRDTKVSKDRMLKHELKELLEGCELEVEAVLGKIVLANLDCKKSCEIVVSKKYIDKTSKQLQKYGFTTQIKGVLGNRLIVTWKDEDVIKKYEYEFGLDKEQLERLYDRVKNLLKESAKNHKRKVIYEIPPHNRGLYCWEDYQTKYVESQLKNCFYKDGVIANVSINYDEFAFAVIKIKW